MHAWVALALALGASGQLSFKSAATNLSTLSNHRSGWREGAIATYDWSAYGSTAWAGAPTPGANDIDCLGSQLVEGGTCTAGGAVTNYGSGTGTNPTPFYPAGFAGANQTARSFDGSTDYLTVAGYQATTALTVCAIFKEHSTLAYVGGRSDAPTNRGWYLVASNGASQGSALTVFKDDSNYTQVYANTNAGIGSWSAQCFSYDGSGGDAHGIILANRNGTAATDSTTAVAPIQTKSLVTWIGGLGSYSRVTAPQIARFTVWNSWAASAAQLATMVAGYQGRGATTGTNLSLTRASIEYAQPTATSALYMMPSGALAVTSAGAQIMPKMYNYAKNSAALDSWTDVHGGATDPGSAAVTANSENGPDLGAGSTAADTVAIPACADADDYSFREQQFTGITSRMNASVYLRTTSGTTNAYLFVYRGATYYRSLCSISTSWSRCTLTSTAALTGAADWALAVGCDKRDASQTDATACGGSTFVAWGGQVAGLPFAGPYVPTTSAAVERASDALTTTVSFPSLAQANAACVTMPITPAMNWDYGANSTNINMFIFGTSAAANSWNTYMQSYATTNKGKLKTVHYDGTGTSITLTALDSVTAANQLVVTSCTPVAQSASRLLDGGVITDDTVSGSGTGKFTAAPTTLSVGFIGGSDVLTSYLSGWMGSLRVCTKKTPGQCL